MIPERPSQRKLRWPTAPVPPPGRVRSSSTSYLSPQSGRCRVRPVAVAAASSPARGGDRNRRAAALTPRGSSASPAVVPVTPADWTEPLDRPIPNRRVCNDQGILETSLSEARKWTIELRNFVRPRSGFRPRRDPRARVEEEDQPEVGDDMRVDEGERDREQEDPGDVGGADHPFAMHVLVDRGQAG